MHVPLSSSVSTWGVRWRCQFLQVSMGSAGLSQGVRGCEDGRWCLILGSPYFQWYFLSKSLHHISSKICKSGTRATQDQGLCKAKQMLRKACVQTASGSHNPCQASRVQDKPSRTVAVICRAGAAQGSSCEYLCTNGSLYVKVWFYMHLYLSSEYGQVETNKT